MNLFEMFEPKKELTLVDALRDFLPIAVNYLKLDHLPKIHLVKELHDTNVPTFGRFENASREITVVVANRNPVDIIRTLAHEMAHYAQGERGELGQDSWHTGSPEENQAHEQAGVIMREFDKQFPEYLSADPVVLPEAKATSQRLDAKCWKGKHKEGTKVKGGVRVNNCVPNESVAEGKPSLADWAADMESKGYKITKDNKTATYHAWDGTTHKGSFKAGVEEDWQKANKHDKTDGMSRKAVKTYRREHPGSKLQTAVTTKPSKLKPGSKAAKRRKSFCARMSGNKGPMKKPNGKPTPKALALRRWNCESVEEMRLMIETAEKVIAEAKKK